jgi:hypothetical protein
MDDFVTRIAADLAARVTGPMNFRLLLQPVMALVLAVRAGLRDARTGRAPFFWAMLRSQSHRRELLREGWKDVGKVFLMAIAIDLIYQIAVLRRVYPGEDAIVAVVLAFVPYVLSRGIVTRLARSHPFRSW